MTKAAIAGSLYAGAIVVDQTSLFPVGTIIFICGIVWWLGRKLQALEDGQKVSQEIQSRLLSGQERMQRQINELPCPSVVHSHKKEC